LAADFRVFYRLSPKKALRLSGPEFMALAHRTSAYDGVMAVRIRAEHEETDPHLDPRRERLPARFIHRESCGCSDHRDRLDPPTPAEARAG
jgi:hypothetical protein